MWQFKDSWRERDGKKRGLCSFPRRTHGKCGLRPTRIWGFCLMSTPFLLGSSLPFSLHRPPVPRKSSPSCSRPVRPCGTARAKQSNYVFVSEAEPSRAHASNPTFFYLSSLNPKWTPWMWGKKQIMMRHGSMRLSHTNYTTRYMIQAGLCRLKHRASRITDSHASVTTADWKFVGFV